MREKYSPLRISEDFYSIQGEGPSAGVPAYFVRLGGCNLMCGGKEGSLVKEGKATWWCDSEAVWRKSKSALPGELAHRMAADGGLASVLNGSTHIVWTGGEPTLPHHQKGIVNFLEFLDPLKRHSVYSEIETNGTGYIQQPLFEKLNQINCSAKLSNSGETLERRVVPDAIKRIQEHNNYNFKFVVSSEDDVKEAMATYAQPFNIPKKNIILMPGVDNLTDLPERTRFAFDMAKKYHVRSIPRLHILAWDKTTGV